MGRKKVKRKVVASRLKRRSTKVVNYKGAVAIERLRSMRVRHRFDVENDVTLYTGSCVKLLNQLAMTRTKARLIITSPPYNIGKDYERHTRKSTAQYVRDQTEIINLCAKVLDRRGSICWQVGNHVVDGYIQPLDILLYDAFIKAGFVLRNRVIWHFEHGLNATKRLSGRYETLLWFTRRVPDYVFNLNATRA